jgi:hypothetical protein
VTIELPTGSAGVNVTDPSALQYQVTMEDGEEIDGGIYVICYLYVTHFLSANSI